MKQIKSSFIFIAWLFASVSIQAQWQQQVSNTDAGFRGLSVVNKNVVWASGTNGTVVRTIDGGQSWQVIKVPDAEKLDFRDVEAFSANVAYVLSIGNGDSSRIYKTTDGGQTWKLQFTNNHKDAFFDAFAFWDEKHGIAMSDPVDGRFLLIRTDDGGSSWHPIPSTSIPLAVKGEGGFAASGTCIFTQGKNNVWFVSGGSAARVYRSTDRGNSWRVTDSPMSAGIESAGIFAIHFKDSRNGVIVGGDYRKPNEAGKNAAITNDGGATWKLISGELPFRSGVVYVNKKWLTVGTSGSNSSAKQGATWQTLSNDNFNVIGFSRTGEVWAAGPKGKISRLTH